MINGRYEMRALYIHAKKFYYRPREKVKIAFIENTDIKNYEFNNVLVSFITIEKGDFERRNEIYEKLISDLIETCKKLNVKDIVLYPYAHLSDNLEAPKLALRFLKLLDNKIRDTIKKSNINVHRAPFGWYKEFMIHCIGHPLAEASRRF